MNKKKNIKQTDELLYLDEHDDQYQQIKDSLEITNSTDSETTNLVGFRVINSNNPYPEQNKLKNKK